MGLIDELRTISEQINDQYDLIKGEAATKNVSVEPFIQALGYDTSNLAEVEPEYVADAKTGGFEKVDYAIKQRGKPIILVEAKATYITLSENHWKQLYNYFGAEDVKFGILTNGIEYRFYTDLKKLNIMDKQPFLVLNMRNLDEKLVNELEGFTKANFDLERNLSSARKLAVLRLLNKEYAQPSEEFVKYFARQIYKGVLSQSVIQAFEPAIRQAWREFVEQKIASRLQGYEESEPAPAETEAEPIVEEKPTKFTSGDSVEVPVFADYKGHRLEATLLLTEGIKIRQKIIRFKGEVSAPWGAAKKAMQTINPSAKWAKNGWIFWKLRDPSTNQELVIDYLLEGEGKGKELVRRLLSHYRQG